MKKVTTAVLALSLLAAGCSAKTETASPSSQSNTDAASGQTGQQASQGVTAANGSGSTSAPAPSDQPSTDKQGEKAPAAADNNPIEKTYVMNKVYNIVPKDENGNKKVVLLTFDDGPKEAKMINPLIDALDKHKAKAIFFVNGYRIKAHPELLKLIHDRGQIIGNHSWDHIDLSKQTTDKIDKQIDDVQNMVKEVTGAAPVFFRPPFGAGNQHVKDKVKEDGMLYMTWSNGSRDWEAGYDKPDKLIGSVMEQLHPGSNILMHELPWTTEALDTLLTKLEEKGYSFVDPRSIDLQPKPADPKG